MAVGDIWQMNSHYELQLNPNIYTYHLQTTVEADSSKLTDDIVAFGTLRMIALQPLHTAEVLFRCSEAFRTFPDKSIPKIAVHNLAGTRTAISTLPGQCQCVVTLYGDILAPTGRNTGRDFWNGQDVSDQDNGKWDSDPAGYMEDVRDYYIAMGDTYEPASGNKFDIGVYSRSNSTPPGGPPAPPPIVPYFWKLQRARVRQLVRTQRRRQPEDPCELVIDGNPA